MLIFYFLTIETAERVGLMMMMMMMMYFQGWCDHPVVDRHYSRSVWDG